MTKPSPENSYIFPISIDFIISSNFSIIFSFGISVLFLIILSSIGIVNILEIIEELLL